MNIIQQILRVQFYNDRVRSARFRDEQYIQSIQDAIHNFVDDRTGNIKRNKNYSFESDQRVRDDLYTLIKTVNATISSGVALYPADYYRRLRLKPTVDSVVTRARPTEYNSRVEENPYRKSSKKKTYFIETATGYQILCGTGTLSAVEFTYLKKYATVSVGKESDKVTTGGILSNAVNYVVHHEDNAVYNGTTYYPGDTIAGTGLALTSGTVIPSSATTNCDLPDSTHEEIAKIAAGILLLTIEDLTKNQAVDFEVNKN